ncbi:MAG: helix-turn-helix domain-containing protein [Solirubrobacteraceae bacterium]|nr:helix-turn-helix domain-containing protein [Solirubrobacteraceae bacterium]
MSVARAILAEVRADPALAAELATLVASYLPTSPVVDSDLLSVADAAEYLRCGRQRIYNLVSEHRIAYLKDGSRVLIRRSDLDAYLERHDVPVARGRQAA